MIGEQTVNKIGEAVTEALLDYLPELDQAYREAEDAFSISTSIKIRPCPEGNRVDVGVSFVTSRVKTNVIRIVNENQMSLLDGIESVELNGKTVFEKK